MSPKSQAELPHDENTSLAHAACDSYSAIVESDSEHLDEEATWLRDQRALHKSVHWFYRPSVVMVGVMIFLIAFGTSSAEATRQMILLKLACNSVLATGHCDPAETQVLVLGLQQAFSVARGIATMVALGKVGPLSDKHGRKAFLIAVVVFGMGGNFARYALTSTYATLQFWPMVATEFFANCSGGGLAALTLANCYVSDIADASQRSYYFGINIASLFVGMSTGPLVENFILSYCKKRALGAPQTVLPGVRYGPNLTSADFAPLRFELLVYFMVLMFIVFVLPESRGETARRMSRSLSSTPLMASLQAPARPGKIDGFCRSINFLHPVRLLLYPKDSVHRLRHKNIGRIRLAVMLLVAVDCLVSSLAASIGEVYVLYGVFRFQWTAIDLGHLMAATCSTRAVFLVVVSPFLTHNLFHKRLGLVPDKRRFDRIDYGVVMIAFAFECTGQLLLSRAQSGPLFLACLMLSSVACIAMPAVHSSIIKFYPESKIGELLGGMAIVKNVCSVVLPVAFLALYKTALSRWNYPQVMFLVLAGLFAVLAAMVTTAMVVLERVDSDAQEVESGGP